ncbi:hypothetical protein N9B72_02335, partial [Bacteriovoracaceae bacterium]|nr:hypothetical protein [Bacteriovoracaceae bacterium]
MRIILLMSILISFNTLAARKCINGQHAKSFKFESFELKNYYQLFYDGSYLSCEAKCFERDYCLSACQKKMATKSIQAYLKEKHGKKY